MAVDIYNVDGGTDDNSVVGRATVNAGGRGSYVKQHLQSDYPGTPVDMAALSVKYDGKFDDPRYYAGDTAS